MSCRAVLSIGANLGDAAGRLRAVVERAEADGVLVAASSLYRTPPWGGVEQDDFVNAVLLVDGRDLPGRPADPAGWLGWAQAREAEAGRTREVRWGPRTLDVDVVACTVDGVPQRSADPALTVPHPRAAERAFVLVPWLEVEPDAELPGTGPVRELLGRMPAGDVAAVQLLGPATEAR